LDQITKSIEVNIPTDESIWNYKTINELKDLETKTVKPKPPIHHLKPMESGQGIKLPGEEKQQQMQGQKQKRERKIPDCHPTWRQ
jgi:hypothetical protein